MNFKIAKIILLVPIILVFIGCSGGGDNTTTPNINTNTGTNSTIETTPPTVLSVSPKNDITNIEQNSVITIIFSEEMNSSTITRTNITLLNGTENIDSAVTFSGTTATLTPSNYLDYYTSYTIKVSTDVKDSVGNNLSSEFSSSFTTVATPYPITVTTFAGSGATGSTDGDATSARFNAPSGLTIDNDGNFYVSDFNNHKIRKITPSGVVITFAGDGTRGNTDANDIYASFDYPNDTALDSKGNLFVVDYFNNLIRKITPSGVVTTFVGDGTQGYGDGTGTSTQFYRPSGITIDSDDNLFIADTYNNQIRKVTPLGAVTTFNSDSSLNKPEGITIDSGGNLFVADSNNHKIKKITPDGVVTTVAGSVQGDVNADGINSRFYTPTGIALDSKGNLFVVDSNNHKIKKITPEGVVTTIAGSTQGNTDAVGTNAQFSNPKKIVIDSNGNLYVTDEHKIRKIELSNIVANVTASNDTVNNQIDISWSALSNANLSSYKIYRASSKDGNYINIGTSTSSSYSDTTSDIHANTPYYYKVTSIITDRGESSLSDAKADIGYFVSGTNVAELVIVSTFAGGDTSGSADATGENASFDTPSGIAIDSSGNLFVADINNHIIRKITPAGVVTTFAGDGTQGDVDGNATSASFDAPNGIAIDASGNFFVTDSDNQKIKKITPSGVVTTFAGGGLPGYINDTGTSAQFYGLSGITIDNDDNFLVADVHNNVIRKITPTGVVTTFISGGLIKPQDIAIDSKGNYFIVNYSTHQIVKITSTGIVSAIGDGIRGDIDGLSSHSRFDAPIAVVIDSKDNLYITDYNNHKIRKVTPAGLVTTLVGDGTAGDTDGTNVNARLNKPRRIAIDNKGNLFVTDLHRVRKIEIFK